MSNYEVGMRIKQKLVVSSDELWKTGTIRYVYNETGLIYREDGKDEDTFILLHGREVNIIADKNGMAYNFLTEH